MFITRLDQFILLQNGDKVCEIFRKKGKMMLFIRGIRDGVHQFVIGYNRKKREMELREEMNEI